MLLLSHAPNAGQNLYSAVIVPSTFVRLIQKHKEQSPKENNWSWHWDRSTSTVVITKWTMSPRVVKPKRRDAAYLPDAEEYVPDTKEKSRPQKSVMLPTTATMNLTHSLAAGVLMSAVEGTSMNERRLPGISCWPREITWHRWSVQVAIRKLSNAANVLTISIPTALLQRQFAIKNEGLQAV